MKQKSKYLELTPEETAKVERAKNRSASNRVVISKEDLMLAELGTYFGWGAIRDVLDDYIELEDARKLVEAGREIYNQSIYDRAIATLSATSNVKGTFEKLMKPYVDSARVE